MLKYQEKLKGSNLSFQISRETVSTVITLRMIVMRFSVEHEEATGNRTNYKNRRLYTPSLCAELGEKASFSKTGKRVTLRPPEGERSLKRELANVRKFQELS